MHRRSTLGRSLAITALFLLAIAVGLRLHRLGTRSLWDDEAVTANASRDTLPQVVDATRHFSAPMACPYVLYLVEKVASSPVAVRMPSVLASGLAVLLMLASRIRYGLIMMPCRRCGSIGGRRMVDSAMESFMRILSSTSRDCAPSLPRGPAHLAYSLHLQPSDRAEEQLIVHSLRPGWDVHCVAAPRNEKLYMASRRAQRAR
jgi:hypothetical protein